MQACRNELVNALEHPAEVANPGLVLSRYLTRPADATEEHRRAKNNLYGIVLDQASCNAARIYRKRYDSRLKALAGDTLAVQGRLIVGLGKSNVFETGVSLHRIYGVPIIPGSALKGLAAHYCDEIWGLDDSKYQKTGPYHQVLFGTTEDSGHVIFHDAWIDPECLSAGNQAGLVLDVMTPHHGAYYGSKLDSGDVTAPTDFDEPIPVSFLSVAGKFHVAVSCDDTCDEGKNWEKLAFHLLKEALANWGVGGKTNSGYGRMVTSGAVDANPHTTKDLPTPIAPPTVPPPRPTRVQVTFLEPHPTLESAFWVQEPDKRKGLVKYGNPPDPLPKAGQQIQVYPTNITPNSLEYRWDPPAAAPPQRGRGPRGRK